MKMKRQNSGFTLVELVVVVMILGILAAVAAPRLLETSDTASENGSKQTLAVIRDAIERYSAQNAGAKPGEAGTAADFIADLDQYLRGTDFPTCPVGNENNQVSVLTTSLSGPDSTTNGWIYSNSSGEFHINSSDQDSTTSATPFFDY